MNTVDIRRGIELGVLPELAFKIKISEEDKEKIATIEAFLLENPEYSFVLYFNHISYNDPVLAAYIIEKIDKSHSRRLIFPASYSHTETKDPKSKFFLKMIEEAKRCGIDIVRLIQAYQVDNPEFGYTRAQAMGTYKNWMKKMFNIRKEGVPTGVLISPEGHRSDDGILGDAEGGMIASGNIIAPVLYIPLSIDYPGEFKRGGFNIGKVIHLSLGEVFVQESRKDPPTLELLMGNLAATLPEGMRGRW